MALALLVAASLMMAEKQTPDKKIEQKREDQSYWGQQNPSSLFQRSNKDQVLSRPYMTSDWIDQRKTGNIFQRGEGQILYATEEQSGVNPMNKDAQEDLQSMMNDIYQEDMPLQGYRPGVRHNWHIDARSRGRPSMYQGVGYIDLPAAHLTNTGLGGWPLHNLEGQPAWSGYQPGKAPVEHYYMGPRSLNERTWHYHVTHGDHRQFHAEDPQEDWDH
jgi:hypothetical protein